MLHVLKLFIRISKMFNKMLYPIILCTNELHLIVELRQNQCHR